MRFAKQCIIHQCAVERPVFRKQWWMTQLEHVFILGKTVWSSLFAVGMHVPWGELIKYKEVLDTMRKVMKQSWNVVTYRQCRIVWC